MNYWLKRISGWTGNRLFRSLQQRRAKYTCLVLLILFGSVSLVQAQSEDTSRTERELPEQTEKEQTPPSGQTPYQMDVLQSDINRYQLRDYGSQNRFYRQLNHLTAEDFLMREEEGYNRYGAEWERKINEDLLKILRATFKEESELVKLLGRIAPFLRFGFFEPYEVPITRVEHPDKVNVEDE